MKKISLTQCRECPFRRTSLPGYLNDIAPEDYVARAHSEEDIVCHLRIHQSCVGTAIYRRNVCKLPRKDSPARRMYDAVKQDYENFFGTRLEFIAHHRRSPS